MSVKRTQIIEEYNYNVENIVFSEPQKNKIPDSVLTYTRINISSKNKDGSVGDLIIQCPELYSFGVLEQMDQKKTKVVDYTIALSLWSRDGTKKEEKDFSDLIERITDKCRQHLLSVKKKIGKADMNEHSEGITKLSPLYWKKNEDGERLEGMGPTLYPKLFVSKKDPTRIVIYTKFNDMETDDEVDPLALVNKHFRVIPALKLESIYIGSGIKLQFKITECLVQVVETGPRRLLKRAKPVVQKKVEIEEDEEPQQFFVDRKQQQAPGSVPNSDDEQTTHQKTPPKETTTANTTTAKRVAVRRPAAKKSQQEDD